MWSGGFVYGFFFEKGIYDISPLNEFLDLKFSGREITRHLSISVANVLSGAFKTFSEKESNETIIKVLQASIAFSGVSPPVEIGDQLYFSGNAIYENDVMAAISHCEALGYKEEDIIIDSIVGGTSTITKFDAAGKNTW